MMFFAMLIVILVLILLVVGVVSLFINIVLTIVFAKKSKKNKLCRILKFITPFLCIGSLILMIPFGLLVGWFIHQYSTIPSDYIECENTILFEENSFESFKTSSGEEYVNLSFEINNYSSNHLTPVYSYKPKGFFNKHKWRNVYLIESSHTFSLYTISYDDQGWQYGVYALKEDANEIQFYYQTHKYWILSNGIDKMSSSMTDLIEKYEKMENAFEIETEEKYVSYEIEACSMDELLIIDECKFFFQNDRVYISTYYIVDGYYKYYGFELFGEEKHLAEMELYDN